MLEFERMWLCRVERTVAATPHDMMEEAAEANMVACGTLPFSICGNHDASLLPMDLYPDAYSHREGALLGVKFRTTRILFNRENLWNAMRALKILLDISNYQKAKNITRAIAVAQLLRMGYDEKGRILRTLTGDTKGMAKAVRDAEAMVGSIQAVIKVKPTAKLDREWFVS